MPLDSNNMLFGYADRLTDEQRDYVDSMVDNRFTIVDANSGSGKTTLAVMVAKLLKKPLVYIFAPVEESQMGFRPGNQKEKEEAYITPLKDALLEMNEFPNKAIYDPENMEAVKKGEAWVYPMSHVFARGINLKGKTVIIDEAQNFTKSELKKILTRIHDDCTLVMIGHEGQCDLDNPAKSGFIPYLEHYRNEKYVKVCELTKNFRGEVSRHADSLQW
jgi:phosphate starvation-inducible PhoH-like protein